MKQIFFTLFFLIARLTLAQEITISTYKDENVDFTKYTSYYWAAQVDKQLDDVHYFLDDLVLKADIRNEVRQAMQERELILSKNDPDLIINFRIFDRATTDIPGKEYWGFSEFIPERTSYSIDEVAPGTLIISLLDKYDRRLVWQGVAGGLWKDDRFEKDIGKIREAVDLLLDDLGYRVNEYTKR